MKRYYSARNHPKTLTLEDFQWKVQHLYLFFSEKNYFKGKAGISGWYLPKEITHKAAMALGFQPFPIKEWAERSITEDHVFDVIEFLHDYVARPGELVGMTSDTGFNYEDYDGYDDAAGQTEFRDAVNAFLCDYKTGFKIAKEGRILSMGPGGLQAILEAEIEPYDEENVDSKVRAAILKWRNRHLDMQERRQAIREMADVFEWLKKTKQLGRALARKDESDLFEIANTFAIRHHDPKQRKDYDQDIWYPWMFHFYLATYHAVIRSLKRLDKKNVG
jgi:hypothetical protein